MPVKGKFAKPLGLRQRVATWNLPEPWAAMAIACLRQRLPADLDAVELFAGDKAVARGMRAHGLRCATIELRDGEDITSTDGLRLAISYLCRCRHSGLAWFGTPCSSWTFVGRSNAGRGNIAPLKGLAKAT